MSSTVPSCGLLDPRYTALLTTNAVATGKGMYSLGMEASLRNVVAFYGHGGSAPGINGDLAIYPQSGYVTAILCNRGYPLALSAAGYVGARVPAA